MSKIMLINVTHSEESRVGIVKDGILESFEIESLAREHVKGNIYKGVVHRIHPALEAAFVDIGGERDAFLPLDEICFRNLPNGHIPEGRPKIKDILKPGLELLVQVVKDQFASKPPTLSTFYSLPGRYLVLLPGSDEAGISRKIEGEDRARLRALIEGLKPPEGFGIIVRTAAGFDQSRAELERDLAYLQRLWESIVISAQGKRGSGLVYREHDLVMRNIRDYFTPDIDEIYIDNEEVYQRARDFLHNVMPGKEQVLHLYRGGHPIFSHFNVESEIESIYKRRVPLRSGGSIVIDGTEALTAIDVNSGGSVRGGNQEETAYRTNLEAATEIGRQLRLRDVGGLIVIDFIDMRQPAHAHEVEKTLRDAMKPDKARHDIARISRFGLLEVSRQRLRPAAAATSYTACPMCEGHGLVRTTESAALVALRKVHNRVAQGDVAAMRVTLRPEVAIYLLNQKREELAQLESNSDARIQIAMSDKLMPHQSEIEVRPRVEAEHHAAKEPRPGEVAVQEEVAEPQAASSNGGGAAGEGKGKKRRRRGRRRGRGRGKLAAVAVAEALAALGAHAGLSAEPSDEVEERVEEAMRAEVSRTARSSRSEAPSAADEAPAAAPAAEMVSEPPPDLGKRAGEWKSAAPRPLVEAKPKAAESVQGASETTGGEAEAPARRAGAREKAKQSRRRSGGRKATAGATAAKKKASPGSAAAVDAPAKGTPAVRRTRRKSTAEPKAAASHPAKPKSRGGRTRKKSEARPKSAE